MITPPYLQSGDKIAIVSPAKKIDAERIVNAVNIFESWGLRVITGKNVLAKANYFAGADNERAADLQEMLDDDEIKAIICARGGYGTLRIIDKLDFTRFTKMP
ncbi:MAG: LD-carboxypeptidase, partial [Bacteroidales bacterium]|nr:LD-carboxypeptidase [Bacteroidales bacterium]MCF8334740.1 LD-carboxypeptidase [Bacteroidales bacterium]